MTEEKDNHKEKKEECPLCVVSEETLKNLKEAGNKKTKDQAIKDNGETRD